MSSISVTAVCTDIPPNADSQRNSNGSKASQTRPVNAPTSATNAAGTKNAIRGTSKMLRLRNGPRRRPQVAVLLFAPTESRAVQE
ncbi:MAG: hypothetical protein QOJ31_162 [Gaiellales bacterium]|nr:hypothetical protein [Gaiellales bacterium]